MLCILHFEKLLIQYQRILIVKNNVLHNQNCIISNIYIKLYNIKYVYNIKNMALYIRKMDTANT